MRHPSIDRPAAAAVNELAANAVNTRSGVAAHAVGATTSTVAMIALSRNNTTP